MICNEVNSRAQSKYYASRPQLKKALARACVKGRWVRVTSALSLFECAGGCNIIYNHETRDVFFSGSKKKREHLRPLIAPSLKVRKTSRSPI